MAGGKAVSGELRSQSLVVRLVLRSGLCILTAGLGPSPSPVLGLLPGRWQARKTSIEQSPVLRLRGRARLQRALVLSRVSPWYLLCWPLRFVEGPVAGRCHPFLWTLSWGSCADISCPCGPGPPLQPVLPGQWCEADLSVPSTVHFTGPSHGVGCLD